MARTTRRPYTRSKRFDASCRGHGSCPWCRGNRKYQETKTKQAADSQLRELRNN